MFENTFVPEKSERGGTVALALILQTIAVAGLIAAPLLSVAHIEMNRVTSIVDPLRELPKPVAPTAPQQRVSSSVTPPAFRVAALPSVSRAFVAPRTVTALLPGDPPPFSGAPSVGSAPGLTGGVLDGAMVVPPPTPPKVEKPKILRMPSALSQSQLLFAPKPDYPRLALTSRTEGVVRLQAIIGRDGTIQNLHVLEGSPLLTQAAIEAVQRWHYRPMLLNGEPVEVITEVDVHFTLQR